MHYRIVLLVKATNKVEALNRAHQFLAPFNEEDAGEDGIGVWDWYQIGGRWSGFLAPIAEEFEKRAVALLEKDIKGEFVSMQEVERKRPAINAVWKEMGGIGPSPYDNHYTLPEGGGEYDVIELSKCLDKVKGIAQDPKQVAEQMRADGKVNWSNDAGMLEYFNRRADSIEHQEFSTDSHVFNVDANDFSVPTEPDGWWAVVVDKHS